ncbi:MAG: BamA/TamA family outer membrane protein [Elusimicrobia bacterium]|nr:BamA/TamA family outer membrane protein [Candidatus Obscuribacterium magneticum]MCB4755491.1 BamA/TamA family outer membrane protein [Candidatus Obscuribacterium magneticum]
MSLKSLFRSRLSTVLLLLFLPLTVWAVSYNNVRVDQYRWQHVQTDHFDIYYDSATYHLIPVVARTLEKAWKNVGERFGYFVPGRTPFFFYTNHNQFEQTNIVPIGEGTGGVTEAFKNRFLVYNDGSQTWLSHVIPHEFTHVVQFNILYGGFWKSIRLLKSPFYALWMMEGMAEYGGGDLDEATMDMVVRDSVANNKILPLPELHGFSHLKPDQVTLAYKTGEAAMDFLADEYGPDKIGKLLVLMKDHFDVSMALEEMLGLDLDRFDFRFQEWLRDQYAALFKTAKHPKDYGLPLTFPDRLPQFNLSPVVSRDGRKMYFLSDRQGLSRIYEYDIHSTRLEILVDVPWSKLENIHKKGRSLSLSPDDQWLAFAGEKKQRDYLYLLNLNNRKMKRVKIPFDEIRSPVFSPVKDEMVCVGMTQGVNDLYLINRKGKVLKRLTENPQDERDPGFSPDGRRIVFSGEVMNETGTEPRGRDLYEMTMDDPASARLLAPLVGYSEEPSYLPDGSILFVRDRDDAGAYGFDLYLLRGSSVPTRLTQLVGGAFSPFYSPANRSLYFSAYDDGEKHITAIPDFDRRYIQPFEAVESGVPSPGKPSPGDEEGWEPPTDPAKAAARRKALAEGLPGFESPLFLGLPRPYRFQASTDLFLPFLYYSTLDGFVFADIWQFSELLGNHVVQQQMQYASGNDYLDLALFYTYARFRPEFTLGYRDLRYYHDIDQTHQRRDTDAVGLVTYPLDRVNSIQAGVGAYERRELYLDDALPNEDQVERYWTAGYLYDTVTGRYLVATEGTSVGLMVRQATPRYGGHREYNSGAFEAVQYIPVPRESTLVGRLFYGRSTGPEPQVFRLGGIDRLRGFSNSLQNKKTNAVVASAEARVRLKYVHWRTRHLIPDFFTRAAYLIFFDDYGYGWDNQLEREQYEVKKGMNSVGVGIMLPTFIMQSFQINFTVQWVKRTTDGSTIWYITLGPLF